MDTEPIAEFFDGCACGRARRTRRKPVRGVSAVLLAGLEEAGLAGRSVLELGAGVGGLTRSMLHRGAARATGVDLSPKSVQEAARLAAEEGLGARSSFVVGDAATIVLEPHDVVVLDKMICCFRDVDRLLANSLPAAGMAYAFALPMSSGPWGAGARFFVGAENLFRRLRRNPFRAYVHDTRRVHRTVRNAGFRPVFRRRKGPWLAVVFVRDGGPDAPGA